MKRVIILAVVALGLAYISDYLWVLYRVHHPAAGQAFGSVDVYYETPLKNGKDEFFFGQSNKQTCVRSMFPQMGYTPCWYASRRSLRSVELETFPPLDSSRAMVAFLPPHQPDPSA
jgi:hypothetical protein